MRELSLEDNLLDMLVEQQLKLGYLPEAVRLYYPLHSLNRFWGSDLPAEEMQSFMEKIVPAWADKFGEIGVSHEGERFCLLVPPKGADHVREQILNSGLVKIRFLSELIELVRNHGTTLQKIHDLFFSYSENVVIKRMENGEFDELIYFEDGSPDPYRYCLTDETVHVTYHRYTAADYEDFHF